MKIINKIDFKLTKQITKLFLLLIISSNIHAQILCSLGERVEAFSIPAPPGDDGEEFSGLAYHPSSDVFIMPLDDENPNNTNVHFKGYHVNTDTEFDIAFAPGEMAEITGTFDFEGLTYLKDNFFLLIEEKGSLVYFLQFNFNANTVSSSTISVINSQNISNSISTNGNKGIEGVTYDPILNKLFIVREDNSSTLFCLNVVSLPTANGNIVSNGEIGALTGSINLNTYGYNNKDAAGLFHLSRATSFTKNNILILSEKGADVTEFELIYDNNLNLTDLNFASATDLVNELQPEGIAIRGSEIYIASEKGEREYDTETSLASYSINDLSFNLTVFLEGPYNVSMGQHNTTLNTERGLLPGQTPVSNLVDPTPAGQPYNVAPWNYNGTEGADFTDDDYLPTDVDWVLVSLRSGKKVNTTFLRAAGILQADGTIRFPSCIPTPINQAVYVVIEHRNHLPIMSPNPVSIVNNQLTFDFTTQDSFTVAASFGQKELTSDVWAAYGGNAEQGVDYRESDDIYSTDKFVWQAENGTFYLYLPISDFNLNGDINGDDKIIWEINNGISTRVNHPNIQ